MVLIYFFFSSTYLLYIDYLGFKLYTIIHWVLYLCNSRTIGDLLGEAKASGNLGNTLKVLGNFEEAIVCCQRHLDISRELNDKVRIAQAPGSKLLTHASEPCCTGNVCHLSEGSKYCILNYFFRIVRICYL